MSNIQGPPPKLSFFDTLGGCKLHFLLPHPLPRKCKLHIGVPLPEKQSLRGWGSRRRRRGIGQAKKEWKGRCEGEKKMNIQGKSKDPHLAGRTNSLEFNLEFPQSRLQGCRVGLWRHKLSANRWPKLGQTMRAPQLIVQTLDSLLRITLGRRGNRSRPW